MKILILDYFFEFESLNMLDIADFDRKKRQNIDFELKGPAFRSVYLFWSIFYLLEYHQVWHTTKCCEHRMYHLHKVKLCRWRTVKLALFFPDFLILTYEMDDFQIFEVK